MNEIGIDFGTTRTKLSKFDPSIGRAVLLELGHDVRTVIPSTFYIPREGKVLVGDYAQDELENDPAGIVRGLKKELHEERPIRRNGRKVNRIELASLLFQSILKKGVKL